MKKLLRLDAVFAACYAFIAFGALLISVFSFSEFTEMEMELLFSKYGLLYLYEPSI